MKKPKKQNTKSDAAQKLHLEKVRISTENVQSFTETVIVRLKPLELSGKAATAAWLDALFDPADRIVVSTDIFNLRVHDVFAFDPPWRGSRRGVYVKVNRLVADEPSGVGGGVRDVDCAHTHLMMELDKCPVPLQEALWGALVHLGLPVVSVVDSGGKSLHAILRVPESTAAKYREMGLALADLLLPFLPDLTSINPSRYTRLPGFMRGDKEQRLLYLNPDAEVWHQLHPANAAIRDLCEGLEPPPIEVRESMTRVTARTSERIQTPESAKEQKEFSTWVSSLDLPGELDMGALIDSLGWRSCEEAKAGKETKHFIQCPWSDEHGGGGDSDGPKDAYIFERDTTARFKWGFHCSHDCCQSAGRGAREVFDRLMSESKEEVLAAVEPWPDLMELLDVEEDSEASPVRVTAGAETPPGGGVLENVLAEPQVIEGSGALFAMTPNEDVDAELFIKMHGRRLRYLNDEECWMIWDKGFWRRDTSNAIRELARSVGAKRLERATNEEERAAAHRSRAPKMTDAILKITQSRRGISSNGSDFDTDPSLIGCLNGVLDLKTLSLLPPDPRVLVRMSTGVNFNPGAFDGTRWGSMMGELFPRSLETVAFLQRYVGSCQFGKQTDQVLLILLGHGCNGKSTLTRTIQDIMGDYAVSGNPCLLIANPRGDDSGAADPALMRLVGKRLACISETAAGARLSEEKVKRLLDGTKVSARQLYQGEVEFTHTMMPILSTNHMPTISSTDTGIRRRIAVVNFTESFLGKEDASLDVTLANEHEAIFNWILEGYRMYQEKGLNIPACVTATTNRLMESMDVLGLFLEEVCITSDPDARCTRGDAFKAYQSWAREQGFTRQWTSPIFNQKMEERGFRHTKIMGNHTWHGIILQDAITS